MGYHKDVVKTTSISLVKMLDKCKYYDILCTEQNDWGNYMPWNNVDDGNIPEDVDLLVYTDEDKQKVCKYHNGRWDTYLAIIGWQRLSQKKPDWLSNEETKRGRKKKS